MLHELYMRRCLDLAGNALGLTSPNPMVGAVLMYDDRIIGEGFHTRYGHSHAEVEAIQSVADINQHLIPESTMYVNLEPCSHHGKTPPCIDLILSNKIKRVVIGAGDPNPKVNGSGIGRLKENSVEVITDVLKNDCINLNKRFYTFHQQQRPYVILKWAQSHDGFMATKPLQRTQISNELSRVLTHKWRTEESSILVGYNTALVDDPELTAREWNGLNPLRIVYDPELQLPQSLKLFDNSTLTWIVNSKRDAIENNIHYKLVPSERWLRETLDKLYDANCLSVFVEGGSKTIEAFIHQGVWDEARVFVSPARLTNGLQAPNITGYKTHEIETVGDNLLNVYLR